VWPLNTIEAVKHTPTVSRRGFDALLIVITDESAEGGRKLFHFGFDRGIGRAAPLAEALTSVLPTGANADQLVEEARSAKRLVRDEGEVSASNSSTSTAPKAQGFRARFAALNAAMLEGAERQRVSGSFAGVRLDGPILKWTEAGRPRHEEVTGARAEVAVGADAQRRITATRIVLIGVFALAFRKQKGTGYLTIEHADFYLGVPFPIKQEKDARAFAAKVNAAARA
jgi:hypothetical protein